MNNDFLNERIRRMLLVCCLCCVSSASAREAAERQNRRFFARTYPDPVIPWSLCRGIHGATFPPRYNTNSSVHPQSRISRIVKKEGSRRRRSSGIGSGVRRDEMM
ncbi:hypothetical protein B0H15DRAFT_411425 [Mycena belliarum]|uniref:Secreted protein n=1 Tax=Mycena belliarum TaxID=1033014 RepID=A0AAD6UJU5_9AGAR|nr:hypothetical protein B0H15DRAFT_411425 [Mycena belliae]